MESEDKVKDLPLAELGYISGAVVEDEPHQHNHQSICHGLGTDK